MFNSSVSEEWSDNYEQFSPIKSIKCLFYGLAYGWSQVGCSPWGREESDTTKRLHFHFSLSCIGEGNGNPLQCSCLENPGAGKPGGLVSMGSHRVGHDWSDLAVAAKCFKVFLCQHHTLWTLSPSWNWNLYGYSGCLSPSVFLHNPVNSFTISLKNSFSLN